MKNEVRIDKWLWAVRIFKTRSIATDACKKGRVTLNDTPLKPSRTIKIGNIIDVRKGPITFTFKVLALSENRMGAKLVPEFMQNITTSEQLEMLELHRLNQSVYRGRGTGRPTKKDRREIEDFFDNFEDEE